jgi:hypothetical protein
VSIIATVKSAGPVADRDGAEARELPASARALAPRDRVSLSPEARQRLAGGRELDEAQQRELDELRKRDLHVRAHEAAHQAAGGELTGPASFTYRVGPDGRSYAVGGEVPIAARQGRTPDETIAIARKVRAAALAPSDPSSADLAAAAMATQVELRAQQQKRQQSEGDAAGATVPAATMHAPEPEPFL